MINIKTIEEVVFVGNEEQIKEIAQRLSEITLQEELDDLIEYAKNNDIVVRDGDVTSIIGYNPKTIRH